MARPTSEGVAVAMNKGARTPSGGMMRASEQFWPEQNCQKPLTLESHHEPSAVLSAAT